MMKKYLHIFMTALLSVVLASCIQEEPYAPGELDAESCYGVYFPTQSGTGDLQIEPDDPTTLTYLVRRANSRGELRVPVTIKSNYPVFSVDEVVFEDGSPVAEVVVHFPTAKIATTYDCTLIVEGDEFVSKYSANPSHLSFSVTRVKWNDVVGPNGETTGRWRDGIFPEWFSVTYPNLERTVSIQERDDMPGYYRIFDVYSVDYLSAMFNSNMSSICVSQHYTYIDATDPTKVWIPTFKTGAIFSPSYGMTSIGSYVAENKDFDPSIASVYGTLKDGVIEFPYGSLQMKLETLGWYATNSAGLHRIILPGYRAKDYDMTVTAGVSDRFGNLPVNVTFGADIAQVKLAVFEGTLTESAASQKAQLIADNAGKEELGDVVTVSSATSVDYSFDETGMYTVVAVGLDLTGAYRVMKHASFGYLKRGDDANQVILSCGLICSDKYASDGMTAKNSLEIYITGKDIQRLHAGFFTKEQWVANEEAIKKSLSGSQMNKASLDLVNGSGLFLKQGYLVPGTEYVLVLQAYNGYREQFFVAEQKTAGDWDPRLAEYDLSDIDMNELPANYDGYFGNYHYYAFEGDMYSRAYLGDVTVSDQFPADFTPSMTGYQFVNIKGLFPLAKTFGLEDDSYSFIYYDNFLYNFEQAFESFYSDGALFYPAVYMYAASGSAYGGRMGLLGAFVQDGYLAIMDSGMYAEYGEVIDGFAVIAYQDPNHKTYAGVIDMVTGILLVREDLDPDPIYDERSQARATASAESVRSYFSAYEQTLRRGPQNRVETFETYLMKAIQASRQQVRIKNYLDVNNLQIVESVEMKPAAHNAAVK
jgi:hypothetical protein